MEFDYAAATRPTVSFGDLLGALDEAEKIAVEHADPTLTTSGADTAQEDEPTSPPATRS